MAMFVKNYWVNKSHITRELCTIVRNHSLAVDHQRKVVKHTFGGDIVNHGGKTFTVCGDFGLICEVYVVPVTALSWVKKAMSEVIDQRESTGVEVSRSLYTQSVQATVAIKAGSPRTLRDWQGAADQALSKRGSNAF